MTHSRCVTVLLGALILACGQSPAPTASGPSGLDIGAPLVPYEAIDLGTLSDRISAQATAINNDGQIVGWSESWQTSQPAHAFLWQDGVMLDLGTLGGSTSRPTDINELGQVVGQSTAADGMWHPFLWSDGVMHDLHPGAPNFNPSISPRVNNAGQVVWSGRAVGDQFGPRYAFLWSDGVLTDLVGPRGIVSAINERGQVVGSIVGGPPFLWENGTVTYLPSLGAWATPGDINDRGQVIGVSQLPSSTTSHAVLWDDGQIADLGVLPGDSLSSAAFITQSGLVVGMSLNDVFAGGHPFRWERGVLLPMSPTYQADPLFVSIAGVNERGTVAGIRNGGREAVVVENGITWVLPGLEGSVATRANGINARGDVVGFVYMDNFATQRAVLWRRTSVLTAQGSP